MRNVRLLEATMQQIVDHPELHYQGWYFWENECGTAGCYAGWACMLSGLKRVRLSNEGRFLTAMVQFHGKATPAWDAAAALLGITPEEALILFAAGNTRAMLQLMVKDLVNGESLRDNETYRQETYQ